MKKYNGYTLNINQHNSLVHFVYPICYVLIIPNIILLTHRTSAIKLISYAKLIFPRPDQPNANAKIKYTKQGNQA
jgi:hypothetical protein